MGDGTGDAPLRRVVSFLAQQEASGERPPSRLLRLAFCCARGGARASLRRKF